MVEQLVRGIPYQCILLGITAAGAHRVVSAHVDHRRLSRVRRIQLAVELDARPLLNNDARRYLILLNSPDEVLRPGRDHNRESYYYNSGEANSVHLAASIEGRQLLDARSFRVLRGGFLPTVIAVLLPRGSLQTLGCVTMSDMMLSGLGRPR